MLSLLIADDTPLIRSTIARVVTRSDLGFDAVIAASNGAEAVELVRQAKPDIIMMDIKMPGLDGLQASAIIRSELPDTRIIILTAYDEFPYVQRALKLGVADYLLKPIRPAKLIEILGQMADQLRRERQQRQAIVKISAALDAAILARPAASDDVIQHVLDYIAQNQHRPDLMLHEVAAVASLSPSHLAHCLKARAGVSYKQYLTAQRIATAKRLLRTTNFTIAAVGEAAGYQNATNFYRLFQRETGMTPAAYRRAD
jgi:two-component system response regulator YesN